MNLKFTTLFLAPAAMLALVACSEASPPPVDIDATVEAKLGQALTAVPTRTPWFVEKVVVVTATPTATPTFTPTPFPPTATSAPTATATPTPIPYTEVSGRLKAETFWTLGKSPYLITDTVQIPIDSALTIEAGVNISTKQGIDNSFLVHGKLIADGKSETPVTFDGFNVESTDTAAPANVRPHGIEEKMVLYLFTETPLAQLDEPVREAILSGLKNPNQSDVHDKVPTTYLGEFTVTTVEPESIHDARRSDGQSGSMLTKGGRLYRNVTSIDDQPAMNVTRQTNRFSGPGLPLGPRR